METRSTVLVVDDLNDTAKLLKTMIDETPDFVCVGILGSADALLDEVRAKCPHIVLLDLSMPGKRPLDVLLELGHQCPETRVLVVSGRDDAATTDAALDAGAWGLVSKHEKPTAILDAIRRVQRGESVPQNMLGIRNRSTQER